MADNSRNLMKSAVTLGTAGIIVKIVGAFFRVFLTNLIFFEGMSYYGKAFPVYSALLVISTVGIPLAISKLVSEKVTGNDYRGAHNVFKVSFRFLFIVGIAAFLLMFFLAEPITSGQALPQAVYSLMAIAPSLFFVSLMSAYRGYFQGLQNMRPTAVSQIIEQVVKFVAGLIIAYIFMKLTNRPELGSMGALIGITISELLALLYVRFVYGKQKQQMIKEINSTPLTIPTESSKTILTSLLKIAIPITIGALIFPLVTLLDSIIIPNGLTALGFDEATVSSMFGVLSGGVTTLINMTAILSQAVQVSIVPSISRAKKIGDKEQIARNASSGMRFAFIEGLPILAAFVVFSRPIIMLLYGTSSQQEIDLAASLLIVLASVALFLPLVQTTNGALQGVGKPKIPAINLAIGTVVKVIISVTMIRIPEINIYAAAIGTVACYTITTVLNCICVYKYTGGKINFPRHVGIPLISTVLMTILAALVYFGLSRYSNTLGILCAVFVGIIIYLVSLVKFRGISENELLHMPGGRKIVRVLKKVRVL